MLLPVTSRITVAPTALRPAALRQSTRRTFASTSHLKLPRSTRASSSSADRVAPTRADDDILSHKLQTVPFQLPPSKARDISYTAAASSFGVSTVFAHLFSRFCQRWFGFSPAVLDSGIVEKAFKMVLVPVWKVDLVMRGKALLEDTELDLNSKSSFAVSALDSSLPGFRLSPLDELPLNAPFAPETAVPFSPDAHGTQHDTPVTIIPFTHHPLNLLSKIASLPRTIEQTDGIGLTPQNFKEVLFATYPIYMPIYLGEFELDNDPEGKRVTTVQFGTSSSPAFSVYPQFLEPPQWLPQSDSISLSISGRPSQPSSSDASESQSAQPGANGRSLLKELEPRLTALMSKLQDRRRKGDDEGMITDRISNGNETFQQLVDSSDRVMAFSRWVERNQEYVEASAKLENVEAMLEQVENMPDNVKSLLISSTSIPKFQDRETLLKDVTEQCDKTRSEVKGLKPEWIERVRDAERDRGGRG
ncbi:uncharacterized protein JCM15063_002296 [Sporobolomyces koalae]|uniref:uncharacterized protein n=1 Tax=Sporobolomyces koalae TaxID=500713 RepID=UPI0031724B64